jgi:phospholipase C
MSSRATSLGRESNLVLTAVEQFDVTTVFNQLATAGKSWGLYFTDVWKENKSYTEFTFPWISKATGSSEIADIPTFTKRAKDGQLPQFTYLEPKSGYGKGTIYKQGTDYHPPARLRPAEEFVADVYDAIRQGPQWNETLFVVTFDEHGGTFDHRPPPKTINPGSQRGASCSTSTASACVCRRSWCRHSSRPGRSSVPPTAALTPSTTRHC